MSYFHYKFDVLRLGNRIAYNREKKTAEVELQNTIT